MAPILGKIVTLPVTPAMPLRELMILALAETVDDDYAFRRYPTSPEPVEPEPVEPAKVEPVMIPVEPEPPRPVESEVGRVEKIAPQPTVGAPPIPRPPQVSSGGGTAPAVKEARSAAEPPPPVAPSVAPPRKKLTLPTETKAPPPKIKGDNVFGDAPLQPLPSTRAPFAPGPAVVPAPATATRAPMPAAVPPPLPKMAGLRTPPQPWKRPAWRRGVAWGLWGGVAVVAGIWYFGPSRAALSPRPIGGGGAQARPVVGERPIQEAAPMSPPPVSIQGLALAPADSSWDSFAPSAWPEPAVRPGTEAVSVAVKASVVAPAVNPPVARGKAAAAPKPVPPVAPKVVASVAPAQPAPGAAFTAYVAGLKVSGVVQRDKVRALINGQMVVAGDVIEPGMGVRLTGADFRERLLIFEDASGAQARLYY